MQPDDVIDQRIQGLMRETRAQVVYPPADPVEYAICDRRGHDLHFYAVIGHERICRWCGVRVRELNPPVESSKNPPPPTEDVGGITKQGL